MPLPEDAVDSVSILPDPIEGPLTDVDVESDLDPGEDVDYDVFDEEDAAEDEGEEDENADEDVGSAFDPYFLGEDDD